MAKFLKETFAVNYAKGQKLKTSTTKKGYHNNSLIDEDLNSYWISQSNDPTPTIELRLETPVELNTFMIQEYLPLGQRIKSFKLEILNNGIWEEVYDGTTVGNKRLVRFESQDVEGIRFIVTDTKDRVVISNMGLFKAPELEE